MQIKILVVEDEEELSEILKYNLEYEGYMVDVAASAEEAITYDLPSYSIIILDIMLGRMSGFDLAKRLRNTIETENTPIIFCSALNGEDEKVMGLNMGADDFIVKPFVVKELLARVRSVLRRAAITQILKVKIAKGEHEPDIIFKNMRIDQNNKRCYVNGIDANLTKKEYELLLFFATHRNNIHSRNEIVKKIWSNENVTERAIDTNVTRLRKKLGQYGGNIITRLGYGYGFQEEI